MPQPKDATGAGDAPAMRIDPDLVRELAELLTANELSEIEVQDGDRRVKVRRDQPTFVAGGGAPTAIPMTAPPQPGHVSPGEAPAEEISGETIKSPMVGTAFLSAQPGAKPFVQPGDPVKAGDTLLIVEAMKVMNPITAPAGGIIKKLLVSDGQPVEFDQPLVVIG